MLNKKIKLNKVLLVVAIITAITFTARQFLGYYCANKLNKDLPVYSVYSNNYEESIIIEEKVINLEDLLVDVDIDNNKNILYLPEVWTSKASGKQYKAAPFFLQDNIDYTGYYYYADNSMLCAINNETFKYSIIGRIVIPSCNTNIPVCSNYAGSIPGNFTYKKNVNVSYQWREPYETNELEVVIGHAVAAGMGRIRGAGGTNPVQVGDIAYLIKNDGTVKIYRSVKIDAHANEQRFAVGVKESLADFWFSSDGKYVDENYKGTDIDLLYTDCCNDNSDYEPNSGYSRENDPGNYAILWEKIN